MGQSLWPANQSPSYFFTDHVGELSHIEKSLCPSSDSMGLLTHPKRKKLNGKNENEHSILAGHADPIYKSWGYKILGKSWGHLKVHVVWSTCYSIKLLIDLTSAFVLGLHPIHCNPCHFPLHIVVVRKKESRAENTAWRWILPNWEIPAFGRLIPWYKLGVVWKVTTKLQLGKGLFPVHLSTGNSTMY